MKLRSFSSFVLLASSCLAFFATGCLSENDGTCDAERTGLFAINIEFGEDDCNYEGTVRNEETSEVTDMVCEVNDGNCSCRGGDEFVPYRITITDLDDGSSQTALIEVESAPPPVCVTRDVIERFEPSMGGAGGAGGATH